MQHRFSAQLSTARASICGRSFAPYLTRLSNPQPNTRHPRPTKYGGTATHFSTSRFCSGHVHRHCGERYSKASGLTQLLQRLRLHLKLSQPRLHYSPTCCIFRPKRRMRLEHGRSLSTPTAEQTSHGPEESPMVEALHISEHSMWLTARPLYAIAMLP